MRRIDSYGYWAAAAVLAVLVSGCTAIGFAVGGMVDSAVKDKSRTLVARAHRGDHLKLHMRDGNIIHCALLWLEEPDAAAYAARYEAWHQSDPGSDLIPRPGERVRLSGGKRAHEGAFQGLAPAGVRIAESGATPASLVLFNEFKTLVDERGRATTSQLLEDHVLMGRVPTGTTVTFTHIEGSGGTVGSAHGAATAAVPWDDVLAVDGPAGRTWKTTGTVLGVFADLTILVALAAFAAAGSSGGEV